MGWLRIDDTFYSHPKVLEAGLEAVGLWTCLLTWSGAHSTDGMIPRNALKMFPTRRQKRLLGKLVNVGLLDEIDGGYKIHDYLKYNASAKEVERKRLEISQKRSEAGARGAAKRWGKRAEKGPPKAKNHHSKNDKSMAPSHIYKARKIVDSSEIGSNQNYIEGNLNPSSSSSSSSSTQVLQETCQPGKLKPVKIHKGKVVDGDDDRDIKTPFDEPNWRFGDAIRDIGDLEDFAADQGWATQISAKDRGRAQSLIQAGAIAPEEIREGLSRMGDSAPARPLSYWLSCVKTLRDEYHREAAKSGPKPKQTRMTPEEKEAFLDEVYGKDGSR